MWRLGVVSYLNTDPLAAALSEPSAARFLGAAAEVRAAVPSALLPSLLGGEFDAALVSTAGVLPHADLRILREMCISSRGEVRSIRLFCRKPISQVRRVALDASSRSGHALTRVLFAEYWNMAPEFVTLLPDLGSMLEEADAALLIGNPALLAYHALETGAWSGPPLEQYDLGRVWDDLTGLPFVYAVWAAPTGPGPDGRPRDLQRLTRYLLQAKEWGMRRVDAFAAAGARSLALPVSLTLDYLTHSIRYHLGPDERAGMERFCALAVRHGVLPAHSAVRFADSAAVPRVATG